MSIEKDKKLKRLLEHWPDGHVGTPAWFKQYQISAQLTQRYLKSGWIKSIGRGAYKKSNNNIHWYSGLNAMQTQLDRNVHLGGPSALLVRGTSHYIRFGGETMYLFMGLKDKLPKWFEAYKWDTKITPVKTSVFPENLGISELVYNGVKIKASDKERAILECLYLAPRSMDLVECYQLTESLQSLRPSLMQPLLEQCSSIKVKRLILYMAKKAKLPVWEYLTLEKIDLGKGDRAIVEEGVYVSEFKISIPKELERYV